MKKDLKDNSIHIPNEGGGGGGKAPRKSKQNASFIIGAVVIAVIAIIVLAIIVLAIIL